MSNQTASKGLIMSQPDILGKIVIVLTAMPQYLGLVLDVIQKMSKPEFIQELEKFARREVCWVRSEIIKIERKWSNHHEFPGGGLMVVESLSDTRCKNLSHLNITQVTLLTVVKDNEPYITNRIKLRRLEDLDVIQLDADVLFTFWNNPHLIPESWKEPVGKDVRYILFEGTVYRKPQRGQYVMCLYWEDDAWHRRPYKLISCWAPNQQAAVILG